MDESVVQNVSRDFKEEEEASYHKNRMSRAKHFFEFLVNRNKIFKIIPTK